MLDRVQNLLLGMEERIGVQLRTLDTKVDSITRELTLNNELLGPLTLENPPVH